MASILLSAQNQAETRARPLNVLRDLPAVADLIEVCFSPTMDSAGKRYVQEMRDASQDSAFAKWANRVSESASLPLTGFVWEEDGKIVGNVSLIPYRHKKERVYLIANVATHPDYRRQGIGSALTERALKHAREKQAAQVWLNVREENREARRIYERLGFVERALRSSWSAVTDARAEPLPAEIRLTRRRPQDWETQRGWLARLYPDALAWRHHWNFDALQPGLWNQLRLFLLDTRIRQWAAYKNEQFQAALAWAPDGGGETLFPALGEESDPTAMTALLVQARRELFYVCPKVWLEFPAHQFDSAIREAGFSLHRTLVWMQATF